jgi:hypothetical protein
VNPSIGLKEFQIGSRYNNVEALSGGAFTDPVGPGSTVIAHSWNELRLLLSYLSEPAWRAPVA